MDSLKLIAGTTLPTATSVAAIGTFIASSYDIIQGDDSYRYSRIGLTFFGSLLGAYGLSQALIVSSQMHKSFQARSLTLSLEAFHNLTITTGVWLPLAQSVLSMAIGLWKGDRDTQEQFNSFIRLRRSFPNDQEPEIPDLPTLNEFRFSTILKTLKNFLPGIDQNSWGRSIPSFISPDNTLATDKQCFNRILLMGMKFLGSLPKKQAQTQILYILTVIYGQDQISPKKWDIDHPIDNDNRTFKLPKWDNVDWTETEKKELFAQFLYRLRCCGRFPLLSEMIKEADNLSEIEDSTITSITDSINAIKKQAQALPQNSKKKTEQTSENDEKIPPSPDQLIEQYKHTKNQYYNLWQTLQKCAILEFLSPQMKLCLKDFSHLTNLSVLQDDASKTNKVAQFKKMKEAKQTLDEIWQILLDKHLLPNNEANNTIALHMNLTNEKEWLDALNIEALDEDIIEAKLHAMGLTDQEKVLALINPTDNRNTGADDVIARIKKHRLEKENKKLKGLNGYLKPLTESYLKWTATSSGLSQKNWPQPVKVLHKVVMGSIYTGLYVAMTADHILKNKQAFVKGFAVGTLERIWYKGEAPLIGTCVLFSGSQFLSFHWSFVHWSNITLALERLTTLRFEGNHSLISRCNIFLQQSIFSQVHLLNWELCLKWMYEVRWMDLIPMKINQRSGDALSFDFKSFLFDPLTPSPIIEKYRQEIRKKYNKAGALFAGRRAVHTLCDTLLSAKDYAVSWMT